MTIDSKALRPGMAVFVIVVCLGTMAHAQNSGGYSGLVAPKKESFSPQSQPRGYGGLIPGQSGTNTAPSVTAKPDAPAPSSAADKTTRRETPRPGRSSVPEPNFSGFGLPGISTASDLAMAAARYGTVTRSKKDAPRVTLPPAVLQTLAAPIVDKSGMTLEERMTRARVDQLLELASSRDVDAQDRAQLMSEIKDELVKMQESLYLRKHTPPDIYKGMGLGDAYIRNTHKGVLGSIAIVEHALGKIQKQL